MTTNPLADPGNTIDPLQLDSLTLEKRRQFLTGLNASAGSPAATALDRVRAEQDTRAADEAADLATRRGA